MEHNNYIENSWASEVRADSYSKLEFPNTYYLAYRDLPKIYSNHIIGQKGIDFGCGTGRSTRFLKKYGFDVVGIDISRDMLSKAKEKDPNGNYCLVENGNYEYLGKCEYDFIQSIFTFDNIAGWETRTKILQSLRSLLRKDGKIILLDSTPELYVNEWSSFTTKEFSENKQAKTGDLVKVIMLDVEDKRPVDDIFWSYEDYLKLFKNSDLEIEEVYKPLGYSHEPYNWKSETTIAPWMIFVLKNK